MPSKSPRPADCPCVPGLVDWDMFGPGVGERPDTNSFTLQCGTVKYRIQPPRLTRRGYTLRATGSGHGGPAFWTDIDSDGNPFGGGIRQDPVFKTPASAVMAARRHAVKYGLCNM